jgi:ribonucleoside-diphosphate reductase beta chain
MAMMFGSQETIHAVAYSYLNETLGLENFEAFLHEPATSERFDNLVAYDGDDRQSFPLSQRVLVYIVLSLFYTLFNYVIYSKE